MGMHSILSEAKDLSVADRDARPVAGALAWSGPTWTTFASRTEDPSPSTRLRIN
jgi:hypothetical protein